MAPTNCTLAGDGGSGPRLVHWHLRKCGGTTIRDAMFKHPAYLEAHTWGWRGLLGEEKRHKVATHANDDSMCGPYRFVVLREPFSQLLSEMDHFPFSFLETRNRSIYSARPLRITRNHMVCNTYSTMGLCSDEPRTVGRCNATAVLEMLDRELDYVGFFERLDATFRTLSKWFGCREELERHGGLAFNVSAVTRRKMEWSFKQATSKFNARLNRTGGRLSYDIVYRMSDRHQQLRDSASRDASRHVLGRAPTRAQFDEEHRCSVEVYRLALERFGKGQGGGPTARALQRRRLGPTCVLGVDEIVLGAEAV